MRSSLQPKLSLPRNQAFFTICPLTIWSVWESDHPEIAIALHRQIAGILSYKTIRATDVALALQH